MWFGLYQKCLSGLYSANSEWHRVVIPEEETLMLHTVATSRLKYHMKREKTLSFLDCAFGGAFSSYRRSLLQRYTAAPLWPLLWCETNISSHLLSRKGRHGCPDPSEARSGLKTILKIWTSLPLLTHTDKREFDHSVKKISYINVLWYT